MLPRRVGEAEEGEGQSSGAIWILESDGNGSLESDESGTGPGSEKNREVEGVRGGSCKEMFTRFCCLERDSVRPRVGILQGK